MRSSQLYIGLACVLASILYFIVDPCTWWIPKCPFKLWTGYSCPACGAQRALHAALHLDIAEAIRYNLFLVLGVPYFGLAVLSRFSGRGKISICRRIVMSKVITWGYIAMFFSWWVVRNILCI